MRKNKAQLKSEAFSLVWCIEKLHLYLYQTKFDVRVDHPPLGYIFGPKAKPSARIERWKLRLQPYNFNIVYHKGSENISNFISRIKNLPKPKTEHTGTEAYVSFITENGIPKTLTLEEIRTQTAYEPELNNLMKAIESNEYRKHKIEKYANLQQNSQLKMVSCLDVVVY